MLYPGIVSVDAALVSAVLTFIVSVLTLLFTYVWGPALKGWFDSTDNDTITKKLRQVKKNASKNNKDILTVSRPRKVFTYTLAVLVVLGLLGLSYIFFFQKAVVPQVTGRGDGTATEMVVGEGFHVVRIYRYSEDDNDRDEVLSQSPSGGVKAKRGSTVIVTLGQNPPFFTVMLASFDKTKSDKKNADNFARQVRDDGISAEVLDSATFGSLEQSYWVVYSGVYPKKSSANKQLEVLKANGYPDASLKSIAH